MHRGDREPLALLGGPSTSLLDTPFGGTVQPHAKVARTHRLASWLCAFVALMFLLVFVQQRFLPNDNSNPRGPATLLVVSLGFFALNRWIASGAAEGKAWARQTSRVCAIIMLPFFPIWTGFGVYLLKYTWRPWARDAAGGV